MKKKTKIFIRFMTVLLLVCGMALPCFGAVSDMSDTIVVDRVYYSSNSEFLSVKGGPVQTVQNGDTSEQNVSFLNAPFVPNYFYEQYNIYSSSGLPIAEPGNYNFILSNLYNYIDSNSGIHYLQNVDRCMYALFYADGTNSGYISSSDYQYVYSPDSYRYSFQFQVNPNKPVIRIHFRFYYDIADYGLPFFTTSSDLSNVICVIGTRGFKIDREEIFPTADSGTFDDYNSEEQKALDASQDGIDEAAGAIEYVGNLITPGKSVYSGILFFGNLMRDFTVYLPELSDILWISLGLGLCIVIVGGVTAVVSSRVSAGNRVAHKNALARERARIANAKRQSKNRGS